MPVLDMVVGGGDSADGITCSPWATSADAVGPCASYDFDPAIMDAAMQMASDVLYLLTRRRWPGECSDTVRPPSMCGCGGGYDRCACGGVSEYMLPGYPVIGVDQVIVDGVIIPPERYRVDNAMMLVYLPDLDAPGEPISGWPRYQRADWPTTEQGTWQVSYTYGGAPPAIGRTAAALLGCEYALGMTGDDRCSLPSGTIQATRQNLTIAVLDPSTVFPEARTGLPLVDLWLESLRYDDEHRPASVWVPGRSKGARRRTS